MRTVGIMLLLLVAMQGCGRKGPLFMPAAPASESKNVPESTQPQKQP